MSEEEIDISTGETKKPSIVDKLDQRGTVSDKPEGFIPKDEHNPADMNMSDIQIADQILASSRESLIPWTSIELPSKGLYYDNWDNGIVQVRAMTQTVEKAMASQQLALTGQSIDLLFRECCQCQHNMDPLDLLAADRIFLLYAIRGFTHGNMYEFMFTCPQCQNPSSMEYDLNDLQSTVQDADPTIGPEPFKISLPYLSEKMERDIWVKVRFLRARDTQLMRNVIRQRGRVRPANISAGGRRGRPRTKEDQKEKNLAELVDDTLSKNLEHMIVEFMGKTDNRSIATLVDKLHARDTATIREWLRENTPGIDTLVRIGCPECNQESLVQLPITESFFRPAKPAGVRT